MVYDFFRTLPSNNFSKFSNPDNFLEYYQDFYPSKETQEEIYKLDDLKSNYA